MYKSQGQLFRRRGRDREDIVVFGVHGGRNTADDTTFASCIPAFKNQHARYALDEGSIGKTAQLTLVGRALTAVVGSWQRSG